MPKLYQYTSLFFIILFITACVPSTIVKNDTKNSTSKTKTQALNLSQINTLSTEQRIQKAKQLFQSAVTQYQTKTIKLPQKTEQLLRASLITSQIIIDFEQMLISKINKSISSQQYDVALLLLNKINAQLDTSNLSHKQKSEYSLSLASISLSNHQANNILTQLNQSFSTEQAELWAMYHQLRAIAEFQLLHAEKAVKEAIVRYGYLATKQQRDNNLNIIWSYLGGVNVSVNSRQTALNSTSNKSEQLYSGWLDLSQTLRGSTDPQTLHHAINFWLQKYPAHQAKREFIDYIIKVQSASVLSIKQLAVLLPLQGKLAKPSKAILDGISASHYNAPLSANIQLRIYDTSEQNDIWLIYKEAVDNGADFIIGPLAKSKLKLLAQSKSLEIPTLALNSLEIDNSPELDNNSAPRITQNLFQFGLSPESTARMVAEKGRQDGHYFAAVMVPDSKWGKRMNKAFTSHWEKLGGVVVAQVSYQAKSYDFSDSIKSMLNIDQSEARKKEVSRTIGRKLEFTPRRRQDIDMLFMAAFPKQAKQIPLQIIYHHGETIPVYSTAHIVSNYHNARQNIDMDGVNFSDMPFLLGTAPESSSLQNTYQSTTYQRLFALGVDSYQLAPHINYLQKNSTESFSGDSGQIKINTKGYVIRTLPWATFHQGNIKVSNEKISQDNSLSHASLY